MSRESGRRAPVLVLAGIAASWVAITWAGCGSDRVRPADECAIETVPPFFGAVTLGKSLVREATVANVGRDPLDLVATLADPDFRLVAGDSVPIYLAVGDTARLPIRFAPSSPGAKSAEVRFSGRTCPAISVAGQGWQSTVECVLEADTLAFGVVFLGQSSVREVALTNAGPRSLELIATLDSPDFELVAGDSVPVHFEMYSIKKLFVRFTPTSEGPKSADIRFSGHACPTVPVTGEGRREVVDCVLRAGTLAFGEVSLGDTLVADVSVTNIGTRTLDLIATLDSPDFSLVAGDSVPVHLDVNRYVSLSVRFAPASQGPKSAEIVFLGQTCPVVPVAGEAGPPGPQFVTAFNLNGYPAGIAVSKDDVVYVDFYNAGTLSTGFRAAAAYAPDGKIFAEWNDIAGHPDGLAAGPGDAFFLVDSARGTILRCSRAAGVTGHVGLSAYSRGRFGAPVDVSVDEDGFIYVMDPSAGRIQKFSSGGESVDSWWMNARPAAQSDRESPFAVSPGGLSPNSLWGYSYFGVHADRRGRVYAFWDTGTNLQTHTSESRLTTYSTAGEVLDKSSMYTHWDYGSVYTGVTTDSDGFMWSVVNGSWVSQHRTDGQSGASWTGVRGLLDVAGDSAGHLYGVNSDSLYKITTGGAKVATWPYGGVAVASDEATGLYVLKADRVTHLTQDGEFLGEWGGSGTEDGRFQGAAGMGTTLDGTVLIADTRNGRIQEMSPDGMFLRKFGNVPGEDGWPMGPVDVAVDAQGNIYVTGITDNIVHKFAPDGTFLTKWGGPGQGPGEFNSPRGIAVGGGGDVYVWDTGNRRVQVFDSQGDFVRAWEPAYETGPVEPWPADAKQAKSDGIAVSANDEVYLTDFAANRVVAFSSDGTLLGFWGGLGTRHGQFNRPRDVAIGEDGRIYVADYGNRRVQVFRSPPW